MMTKEKKIEIIKRNIETIKNHLKIPIVDEYECVDLKEQLKYELSIYERELKILQIEPRTIDNMQVGDYIEFDYINGNKLIRHYKGVVTELGDELFYILNCYNGFYYDQIHYGLQEPIIIPYEFLELWGEINEN